MTDPENQEEVVRVARIADGLNSYEVDVLLGRWDGPSGACINTIREYLRKQGCFDRSGTITPFGIEVGKLITRREIAAEFNPFADIEMGKSLFQMRPDDWLEKEPKT